MAYEGVNQLTHPKYASRFQVPAQRQEHRCPGDGPPPHEPSPVSGMLSPELESKTSRPKV